MTNTLATRKQSEAIRQRMAEIRSDLPYDVDVARQSIHQITDWRYQFRQYPVVAIAAAVVIGYVVVPHAQRQKERVFVTSHGESVAETKAAKRGMLSGIVAAAATMALRSATSMLAQHVSQSLMGTRPMMANPHETLASNSTKPPQQEHFTS